MYDTDKCTLCDLNARGDEYHYILICPFFKQNREMYLKCYYYNRPSLIKFEQLFSSNNASTISKLAKFVKDILACFWLINYGENKRKDKYIISYYALVLLQSYMCLLMYE